MNLDEIKFSEEFEKSLLESIKRDVDRLPEDTLYESARIEGYKGVPNKYSEGSREYVFYMEGKVERENSDICSAYEKDAVNISKRYW